MTTRYLLFYVFLFVGCLCIPTPCAGQSGSDTSFSRDSLWRHISREMSAEAAFQFTYPQGNSAIRADLGNNAAELDKLEAFIGQALSYSDYSIGRICLTGYSSIEGDYSRNEALARERVEQFYRYLCAHYPELRRFPHDLAWVAEDWSGLARLVKASGLNERDEILEIIHKVRVYDDRELLLMKLNGGHVYRTMERTMFPGLRRVELRIDYQRTPLTPEPTADPLIYNVLEEETPDFQDNRSLALANELVKSAGLEHRIRPARNKTNYKWAIKTNVLQWTGVQPDLGYTTPVGNMALEYYINPCFSVEAGAMYSYWHYNSGREFQGVSGYRLEPRYRYRFPCDWLEVYSGLYVRLGDYDHKEIENGKLKVEPTAAAGQDDTDNYTGNYWDVGLSAGVTFGIGRGWAVEVGARAGYVSTNATKYTEEGRYNWYESKRKYNKMRVTDLNVSLLYRF